MLQKLLEDWEGAQALLTDQTHYSESAFEEIMTQAVFYQKLAQVYDFKTPVQVLKAYGFEYAQLQSEVWIKANLTDTHIRALHLLKVPKGSQRIMMEIAYDGTLFEGFQRQASSVRTVQGELESALSHLHPEVITLHPASRTDKGVHAQGQRIQFDTHQPHTKEQYLNILAKLLPRDIQLQEVTFVPSVFHVRYDVWMKTYHYRLSQNPPITRVHQVYRTHHPDLETINKRLAVFVGTHDFANFAKLKGVYTTVRTLTVAKAYHDNEDVIVEIQGRGFARYMVRMLVGAVLRYDEAQLTQALNEPTKPIAKHLAPAHGLTLHNIQYRQA